MDPALATTLAGLFLVVAGLFWMQLPRRSDQGFPVAAAFVVLFGAALLAVGMKAHDANRPRIAPDPPAMKTTP
jgi:peptidoglycan/LPS O-acetylase OafA/YrhL